MWGLKARIVAVEGRLTAQETISTLAREEAAMVKSDLKEHNAICGERHKTINGKIDALIGYQRWQNRGLTGVLFMIVAWFLVQLFAPHIHFG
jgi:hypothetical protein